MSHILGVSYSNRFVNAIFNGQGWSYKYFRLIHRSIEAYIIDHSLSSLRNGFYRWIIIWQEVIRSVFNLEIIYKGRCHSSSQFRGKFDCSRIAIVNTVHIYRLHGSQCKLYCLFQRWASKKLCAVALLMLLIVGEVRSTGAPGSQHRHLFMRGYLFNTFWWGLALLTLFEHWFSELIWTLSIGFIRRSMRASNFL